jgi:hypothetical protein
MTKAFIVLDLNDANTYTNDVNIIGIYSSMLNAAKAKQRTMAKAIQEGIEDNTTIGFFEKKIVIKEITLDQIP